MAVHVIKRMEGKVGSQIKKISLQTYYISALQDRSIAVYNPPKQTYTLSVTHTRMHMQTHPSVLLLGGFAPASGRARCSEK